MLLNIVMIIERIGLNFSAHQSWLNTWFLTVCYICCMYAYIACLFTTWVLTGSEQVIKCCCRFSACKRLHKRVTSGILSNTVISNYVTSCTLIPLIPMEPSRCIKLSIPVIHCSFGAEQYKIRLLVIKSNIFFSAVNLFLFNYFHLITFNYSCYWWCYSPVHYPLFWLGVKLEAGRWVICCSILCSVRFPTWWPNFHWNSALWYLKMPSQECLYWEDASGRTVKHSPVFCPGLPSAEMFEYIKSEWVIP